MPARDLRDALMEQTPFLVDYERSKAEIYGDYGTTEQELIAFCE
jgi:hypothetical protein